MKNELERTLAQALTRPYTRRGVLKGTVAASAGALVLSALGGGFAPHGIEASGDPTDNNSPGAVYALY